MLTHLDRYILKEITRPFLLGIFILMFVLIMQQILSLMELVIDKGVDLLSVGALFLNLLPSFFVITIPMAVMMATVTAFNRLSADNEIIALHAAGIGFFKLFRPVFYFALSALSLTLFMGLKDKSTGKGFNNIAVNLLLSSASAALEEGRFNDVFSNMMIYVESMPSFSELQGVFIYDQRKPEMPTVIVAKRGILLSNKKTKTLALHLEEGSLHQKSAGSEQYQKMTFTNYDLKIDFSSLSKKTEDEKIWTYARLKAGIAETKGKNVRLLQLLSEYYGRFFFALAAFLFCIIGMPLGILSGRMTRVGGFAIGVAIITLYYVLLSLGNYLASTQGLPPFLAAATPVIALSPFAFYLLKKVSADASPTIFGLSSKRP